jgi:hypothetical protein
MTNEPAAPLDSARFQVRLRHGQIGVHVARLAIDEVRMVPGGVVPVHTEASVAHDDLVNGGGAGYAYVGG